MDLDLIKLIILAPFAAISLIVILAKKKPISIHIPTISLLIGLVLISLHYYVVAFSINEENSSNIAFAAALWVTTFLCASAFDPGKALDAAYKIFSLIAAPITAILVYQQNIGAGEGDYSYFIGVANNPNIMGGYLALFMFPIALQNFLNKPKKFSYFLINTITLIAIIYLIYLTGSRGSAVAVGASLAYISLNSRIKLAYKAAVLISILMGALLMQEFFLKYEGLGIVNTREYLIILRLEAIAERPWFGWGFAADVNNSFNGTNMFPPQEKGNTALQFIEEFGLLLGVPLFLSIVGLCVAISVKLRDNKEKTWIVVFMIAALTHSMVETWMLNFRSFFAIAFWVILFLSSAFSFGRKMGEKHEFPDRSKPG